MKSFRIFAAAIAVAGLGAGVSAATANAAPAPQPYTCQNQYLDGGTYGPLTVKGWCTIDDESTVTVRGDVTVRNGAELGVDPYSTLRVRGNVTLQSGSLLGAAENSTTAVGTTSAPGDLTVGSNAAVFADYYGSTFHVYGSLSASNNSFLALGCTEAHPCEENPESAASHPMSIGQAPRGNHVTIGGNAFLAQVLNATIDGVNIGGNLIVSGGGDAQQNDPNGGYMPIKDNKIGGSVTISGFHGYWFGLLRNIIGGNASITGNSGVDSDSTEVVANQIGGNLVCAGNIPPAQFGDAIHGPGYGKNFVGGQAVGECKALTKNPVLPE